MLSSSSLHKNKEVLARNGGGKFGKGICFSYSYWLAVSVALEHNTPYSSFEAGLGNPFVSHSICYKVIPYIVFESMLPNHWSCHSYVQEKSIWNLYWVGHLQLSILSVSTFPMSGSICIILYFTFKIYYSFHVIDGGYIKALLWRFLFRRLQLIIRKQDLEILWYLGTCMPQWQVSSLSTVGFHYWPLIGRFRRVFDFSSFIHSLDCTSVPWDSLTLMVISLALVNGIH